MVELVHGRGQLGEALKRALGRRRVDVDAVIYHTWNHTDKDAGVQAVELAKFKEFVDWNENRRIFFTSAIHEHWDPYGAAKLRSELYLWDRVPLGSVIRLPYMLGSGFATKLKEGRPYLPGTLEVSTFDMMADRIVAAICGEFRKLHTFHGERISADLLKGSMTFGAMP